MWIDELGRRLRFLFRREQFHRDMEEEMRLHEELRAELYANDGVEPGAARRAARRTFGNTTLLQEVSREMWGWRSLDTLWQDARYALRTLANYRSFSVTAIAILALGIGANTAIFSVVDGILFRPLRYAAPERLIEISGTSLRNRATLVMLQQASRTADYAAHTSGDEFNLTGQGEPARLTGSQVSANLFHVLGVRPLLGRDFRAGENTPASNHVAILSYALWQSRFRGDRAVIGQSIRLDDSIREVVGIMPADFRFPTPRTELWIPMRIDPVQDGEYWWVLSLTTIGRLRPGANIPQAQAELQTIVPRIRAGFPWKMWPDWGAGDKVISLQEALVKNVRTRLLILLGSVALVLVIACANVANLLLSRAVVRQREIALRAALGASRGRIARQLLTESVVLALAAGALGMCLAVGGAALLKSALPAGTPRLIEIGIDWRVLGFTAALALATGISFGLWPAISLAGTDPEQALKTSQRTGSVNRARQRMTGALVVFEIAVAVVVVSGAGLLSRSLWRLVHVEPGFQAANLLTARVTPNDSLCKEHARCLAFYSELLTRLRALPGVLDVAAVNTLPLTAEFSAFAAELEDHPVLPGSSAPALWLSAVTIDYLRTMRIPLLRGRNFTAADREGAPLVALVSARTAQRWWPGQDPIGKHVRPVWLKKWHTVVGVTGDVRAVALGADPAWMEGEAYVPYAQGLQSGPVAQMDLVLKTSSDPLQSAPRLRSIVSDLNPDVPVTQIRTMDEIISASVAAPRSSTFFLAAFAVLALLLGAVGIYGVIAYAVTQRTQEIGIRMALGAHSRDIRRMVLGQTLLLGATGITIGIGGALAATRALRSLLYGVSASDPATFLGVCVLLLAVAMLAGYLPARRATRIDPTIALRYE